MSTGEPELGTLKKQWEGRRFHNDKEVEMALREW